MMENVALVKELMVRLLELETPAPKRNSYKYLQCLGNAHNTQEGQKRYSTKEVLIGGTTRSNFFAWKLLYFIPENVP